MINSLVLPTEPNPEFTLVWTGYKAGPMMGQILNLIIAKEKNADHEHTE
jgi:hypothetical protein